MPTKKIIVELQHFEGCPNGPKMKNNVEKAIDGLNDFIEFHEVFVETDELARELKFRGSPTLLIDGKDFEELPEPENPYLNCRFYPKGVPGAAEIRKSLEIAIKKMI